MKKSSVKKTIGYIALFLLLAFVIALFIANRYIEPVLRKHFHTLIIQGSDSLYRYQLGDLSTNLFTGSVEVENLQIRVDSSHYKKLSKQNALPALSIQLDLKKGRVGGLSILALLLSKKIKLKEVVSDEANVRIMRHIRHADSAINRTPLWKSIQPAIKSIEIDRVALDGVNLLYKHADTPAAMQLQFDRCNALFQNIKVDSTATADTNRIVFAKDLSVQFGDLAYRASDSSYNIQADGLHYKSVNHLLQIKGFKIQSALERGEFFRLASFQKNHFEIDVAEASFFNFHLDRFINSNIIVADSVLIKAPKAHIGLDRTLPISPISKYENYPHQLLLRSNMIFRVNKAKIQNSLIRYTERGKETGKEGSIEFSNANILINNITNDAGLISKNARCIAIAEANVFDSSVVRSKFTFHLDSDDGKFDVEGTASNINAAQLNTVAEPLGNATLQSLNISNMAFQISGDKHSTIGNLEMRYSNLAVSLRKTDEETGKTKPKKFLNKVLNKFVIYPDNPGDGAERVATNIDYARLSSQGFFGVVWKTLFFGMQNIMIKSGRYE